MKKAEKIEITKLTLEDLEKVSGSMAKTGGTEGVSGRDNCACVCG